MWRFAGTGVLIAVFLAGCSQNHTIDSEELKSDATKLTSIAAEGELFSNFVADGHSTTAYAKGHPEYLCEQSKQLRKDLQKSADPSLQDAHALLQTLSQQLDETLAALPSSPHDSRWPQLAASFGRIAHSANALRRAP